MFNRFFIIYFVSIYLYSIHTLYAQEPSSTEQCFIDHKTLDATQTELNPNLNIDLNPDSTPKKKNNDKKKKEKENNQDTKNLNCLEELKTKKQYPDIIDLEKNIRNVKKYQEDYLYYFLFSKMNIEIKNLENDINYINYDISEIPNINDLKNDLDKIKKSKDVEKNKKDELEKLFQKYDVQFKLNKYKIYKNFIEGASECIDKNSNKATYCKCDAPTKRCQILKQNILYSPKFSYYITNLNQDDIELLKDMGEKLDQNLKNIYISLSSFVLALAILLFMCIKYRQDKHK